MSQHGGKGTVYASELTETESRHDCRNYGRPAGLSPYDGIKVTFMNVLYIAEMIANPIKMSCSCT